MRYVNGFFCVMLTLFALVQYNDPDALVWLVIYAIAAVWAGVAAFRPDLLVPERARLASYAICLAAALVGSIYLWPSLPANWIDIEEEREGLGLMIATIALVVVGVSWWRHRRSWDAHPAQ